MIAEHDTYRTPAGRRSAWTRLCPVPRVNLYLPVLGVVIRANRLARQDRYGDREWVHSSLTILRALEGTGMRVSVEGLEHLRALEGPAVFLGNHMSTLETFVLPGIIHPVRPVTFVVKGSLLTYPLFGPIMRSRDPVAVGRRNPREDLTAVLRGGAERLGRGISVIVFPQTTRTSRFDPAQFNTIGVKLAARAGVPVVPVALRTDAWGNGRWVKDFGPVHPDRPVHFRFGEPLVVEGKGAAAHEATVRFIQEALAEWEDADRELP